MKIDYTSVIKNTLWYIIIQCALIFVVLAIYVSHSYLNIQETQIESVNNLLEIYGNELNNKLENADLLLAQMIYKNDNYDMLKSSKESDRYYATVKLKSMLEESVTYNPYVDAFLIAESNYGICIDYENKIVSYEQRMALREYTKACADKQHLKAQWTAQEIGGKTYLYKMYVWQGEAAAVYISSDNFLGTQSDEGMKDTVISLIDKGSEQVIDEYGERNGVFKEVGERFDLENTDFSLVAYSSNKPLFGQLRYNVVSVGIILFILLGFTMFMIRHLKKNVLFPIGVIKNDMEKIQEGDYKLRIKENFKSKEFNVLKNSFNQLMDEIVGLKILAYEKQIVMQEMELKCVKLQIRPHFFLNAMTTISSLSQQGKNAEITRYIGALSKNIRYMFKSGLHTVSLEEEIQHVENYFEMQELKYPGCVFYYMDIQPEVMGWEIPQMLIHTIIENEYKYAVSMNKMLTILIKAVEVVKDGEEVLLLEIEDDGQGYPQEILEEFNQSQTMGSKDGSRVGLWSIKRMLEIMYERKDMFLISNVVPHGCKNEFWIPKSAIHEVQSSIPVKID